MYRLLKRRPLLLSSTLSIPFTFLIINNSDSLPSPSTPHQQPLKALIRSYIVYSLCSFPALVDASPAILDALAKVPVINRVAYAFVRITFFDQFVGGDTATSALPLLYSLRRANKGALFAYSVEVDEKEAIGKPSSANRSSTSTTISDQRPHSKIISEILSCIDVAANFEDSLSPTPSPTYSLIPSPPLNPSTRRTWVALKFTALLPDAHALQRWSEWITLQRLHARMLGDHHTSHPTIRVEDVPFPGCPLPSDMHVLGIDHPIDNPYPDPDRADEGERTSSIITTMTTSIPPPIPIPTPLLPQDITDLRELYQDLVTICEHAKNRNVKIIIDAEYSWYQPALDALTLSLMQRFNALPSSHSPTPSSSPSSPPSPSSSLHPTPSSSHPSHHQTTPHLTPLIYTTHQTYLRRSPSYLLNSLLHSQQHGYALGIKLVRGAYWESEVAAFDEGDGVNHDRRVHNRVRDDDDDHLNRMEGGTVEEIEDNGVARIRTRTRKPTKMNLSISRDAYPPVWGTKQETDKAYEDCVKILVGAVADDVFGSAGRRKDGGSSTKFEGVSRRKDEVKKRWWLDLLNFWKNRNRDQSTTTSHPNNNDNNNAYSSKPPTIGVLFGTHNWDSCRLILDEIVRTGLGREVQFQDEDEDEDEKRVKMNLGVVSVGSLGGSGIMGYPSLGSKERSSPSPSSSSYQHNNSNNSNNSNNNNNNNKILLPPALLDRISIGQLYGMCDDLTDWLVSRTSFPTPKSLSSSKSSSSLLPSSPSSPSSSSSSSFLGTNTGAGIGTLNTGPFVIKYVPYGGLMEVMPYLSRRAVENKSVLGGGSGSGGGGGGDGGSGSGREKERNKGQAERERERAKREIVQRVKGWFGFSIFQK